MDMPRPSPPPPGMPLNLAPEPLSPALLGSWGPGPSREELSALGVGWAVGGSELSQWPGQVPG